MIMTTKGKVYSFYSIVIVLLILALMVFNLNIYAKAVICFFIIACLLVMRSVQKAWMLPPDFNPYKLQSMSTTAIEKLEEKGEEMESGTHSDNIDAYLSLVIRADMELSEDPCVDKESSTYNRLLNARISEYLHASK